MCPNLWILGDWHPWLVFGQSVWKDQLSRSMQQVFFLSPLLISSKENAGFKRDYVSTTQFLQMTGTYLDCSL